MHVTITRAAGKPRLEARLTAARAPWLAFEALPGDSPGMPRGWSVHARSRNEEEELEEELEAAVPLPNSATSSAALAAAPASPSSIASVTRYLVEAPGCAASLARVERRTWTGS